MTNNIRESVMVLAKGPGVTFSTPIKQRQLLGPVVTETLGSCFLFTYQSRLYVVTCRHVVEGQISSDEQCKVILRYQKKGGSTDGAILPLDTTYLRYHPEDTSERTFDIAAFVMPDSVLSMLPVQVWSLEKQDDYPVLDKKTKIKLIGYPKVVLTDEKIRRKNMPINPLEVWASIASVPSQKPMIPSNSPMPIIGTYITEIDELEISLEGASGGIAIIETKHGDLAFGILSATGSGELQNRLSGTKRQIDFVCVIPMIRLIETIIQ
jgi:hypothetical protein